MQRTVMMSVDVSSEPELVKAIEVMSRSMAGLTLEGLEVRLTSFQEEPEDADDPSLDV